MKKENPFFRQADLLLRLLPYVAEDSDFALHGGTAINFFVREMPRLSVDIDLTYLRIEPRDETIVNITEKMRGLAKRFRRAFPGVQIEERADSVRSIAKLFVRYQNALVKIEPNLIIRGSVFPIEERDLSKAAEGMFEKSVSVKTLSVALLYGGKICAALDRQHPRDLFDVKLLFENEGFSDDIRKAFLVYLMSGNRQMVELLNPKLKEVQRIFEGEFSGMTLIPVTYIDLEDVRKRLIQTVNESLTQAERTFLVSFKEGRPDWRQLGIDGVDKLPAVQWKLDNLEKMDRYKHSQAVNTLREVLGYERVLNGGVSFAVNARDGVIARPVWSGCGFNGPA